MREQIKSELVLSCEDRKNALGFLLSCEGNPKKILIISYSFTNPFGKNDFNHDKFIGIIRRLISAGVEINLFIPQKNIDEKNRLLLRRLLDEFKEKFLIFLYMGSKEYLHAKLILRHSKNRGIDEFTTYLTSANFTYNGVNSNFEMGVLLEDNKIFNTIEGEINKVRGNDLQTKICEQEDLDG